MQQRPIRALVAFFLLLAACLSSTKAGAQEARLTPQAHFPKTVPAGDYSGIAALGGDRYAVVSDKADGFFVFSIVVDSVDGHIVSGANEGFHGTGDGPRDAEGICFLPQTGSLLIVGEGDNKVREYLSDGSPTGRELSLEPGDGNQGYESLTYDDRTGLLWTCTEGALPADRAVLTTDSSGLSGEVLLRLQSFDKDLQPQGRYDYLTDRPQEEASRMRNYAFGVSELLALGDGSLLVLEREFAVPKSKVGAWVANKVYRVKPEPPSVESVEPPSIASVEPPSIPPVGGSQAAESLSNEVNQGNQADAPLPHRGSRRGLSANTLPHGGSRRGLLKTLVAEWKTRLTLTGRSLANYEGMCLGPTLADGTQTVILVADSQSHAGGVLRDWFRTLLLPKSFE